METGAEEAFTDFVKQNEPQLRIALLAAYGAERGREAAAEALAYAWEHWERIRDMEKPVGYLYRVGQSRSRQRLRPAAQPMPALNPDPWVEPKLPAALRRLSRKQRMAVVLVHGYGWTQHEAADVMGTSDATVRTHLNRGLEKLRSVLGVSVDV